MSKDDFDLLIITSPENLPKETELINFFLDHGAHAVYIRKENYSEKSISHSFGEIKEEHHHRIILPAIVVSDSIFKKYNPIIHVKEKDRDSFTPEIFDDDAVFSTSIHDFSGLKIISDSYQYFFYSPVFGSISKPGYKPKVSIDELAPDVLNFKLQARRPKLIALGGINKENIKRVKETGFDGAALLGAIWNEKDPREIFQQILSKIR